MLCAHARSTSAETACSSGAPVNFFGHAVVSRWCAAHPAGGEYVGGAAHALGAMLPDFASMCGGTLATPTEEPLAAGVALHHRTDAVFHHHRHVLELMGELHERLLRAGCGRGPARAGSHIGIELLLDGVLLDDGASCALYREAIAHSPEGVRWREAADEQRFAGLRERLLAVGVPLDLRRPRAAALRLVRTLARRPRLAPGPGEAALLESGLEAMAPRVERLASLIVREVVAGVGTPGE